MVGLTRSRERKVQHKVFECPKKQRPIGALAAGSERWGDRTRGRIHDTFVVRLKAQDWVVQEGYR